MHPPVRLVAIDMDGTLLPSFSTAISSRNAQADWCPACGGSLVERAELPQKAKAPAEIDHRGIVLPRRHALGGIITPQ